MVLFASVCFSRLSPMRVFRSVFWPSFPPNSQHSTHHYPSVTMPFSFINQQSASLSKANCISQQGKLYLKAMLFHAKSKAKCGTQHMFCTKRRVKVAKRRARRQHSPLSHLQQPHARMNYLRPRGEIRSAKAAIMLKNAPKILLIERYNPPPARER